MIMGIGAYLQQHWVPVVGIVVGSGAALVGFGQSSATGAAPVQAATAAPALSPPSQSQPAEPHAAAENGGQTVSGKVLEQIDVGKYSYLRLGQSGAPEVWAAVSLTPSRVGEQVTIQSAELMTNFASATLKRTFDAIYFGFLSPTSDSKAEHVAQVTDHARGLIQPDSPKSQPHSGAGEQADRVPVGQVKRALGPLGRTVAEINQAGAASGGTKARLRAIVVKSTPGVLGRTFLHVRDGSGDRAIGSHDLAVTTTVEPAVGSEVLFEGTVEADRDFGSGYRYPVLLADATLVEE